MEVDRATVTVEEIRSSKPIATDMSEASSGQGDRYV
jgi:hypothetical protein